MFMKLAAAGVFALSLLSSPALAQNTNEMLTIDLPGEPATLDPHLQWDTDSYSVYRNIFDNLLTRDKNGEIAPMIATAWKYVDDKTIDFDIREGVKFHDGTPLTADDVVFSITRIIDPKFRSPQLSQFDQISDAQALGPTKVRMTTKTAYPALLAQLVKLSIVPAKYVTSIGDQTFNEKPIGSGPYKLRERQKGVQTLLEANTSYWRGTPPFKSVAFRAVPDVSTRIADLRTGQADLARQFSPDQAENIKNEPNLKLLTVPTERVGYLYINAQSGPTQDLRVRQAIAYAIDKQSLVEALLQGYGKPVDIIGAEPVFGYTPDVKGYEYDPEKARALVKEAGAVGARIEFITSAAYDRAIVEAIQQMINDTGLKVEVAMLDQPTFLQRRQGDPAGAGHIAVGQWSCACQDADGIIFPLFRSGGTWAKYSNPDYDEKVDAARSTLDKQKRLSLYKEAYEILRKDVPGIGLYQVYAIYGASKHLNWQPTADESMFIMDMSWQN
jgi:peptide/nickel transport system substrate-binding protein